MTVERGHGKAVRENAVVNGDFKLRRRDLLAAGAGLAMGLDAAGSSARAASELAGPKIDAHTHFAPPEFLQFAEQTEGRPFPLSPLYRSLPALTDLKARLDLLDRNGIDMHVLVPVPWLEGFHKTTPTRCLLLAPPD